MYEMYPDAWAAVPEPSADGEQPRRRAHRVTPSILVTDDSVTEDNNEETKRWLVRA